MLTLTTYPWLAKPRGGHPTWNSLFCMSIVFAKFCPQVVNSCFYGICGGKHGHYVFNIWHETFKVYFLPHKNFSTWGLRVQAASRLASYIYWYCSIMISKATYWQTFIYKAWPICWRSSVWFFLAVKLSNWSELHRSSVSRNDLLRAFGYWLPIMDWVSQSISGRLKSPPIHIGLCLYYLLDSLFVSSNNDSEDVPFGAL